jgi:transposase-like protein
MRKVLKTRTQFPNDDAVIKTLWLAILDIEDKRAGQRTGKPATSTRASRTTPASCTRKRRCPHAP